jgi:hypothetical protein
MPRYVIERDIPEIGSAEREALRGAAFCIYISDNEALIHEHAERSGFPATKVTEVRKMIDPVTAEG